MDIHVLKVFVHPSNVVMDSLFGAFTFSILLSGSMERSRPWLVSINSSFKFCSFNKFLFNSLARSKNSPFKTSAVSLGGTSGAPLKPGGGDEGPALFPGGVAAVSGCEPGK